MRPDLPVVLATDLDGTFLHGTEAQRRAAYGFLRRHRAQMGMVFVTGRELERVILLREDPEIPRPDHIIADVGTVAVDGQTLVPFGELRAWVEGAWGGANACERCWPMRSEFAFSRCIPNSACLIVTGIPRVAMPQLPSVA
jgi:Sucrose-6F-phosphate phosphohydrolase